MRWTSEAIDGDALRILKSVVTPSPCRFWPSGKSLARVRELPPAAASEQTRVPASADLTPPGASTSQGIHEPATRVAVARGIGGTTKARAGLQSYGTGPAPLTSREEGAGV